MAFDRRTARNRRRRSIRKRVAGTSDRPRLSVYRSARHIYAQVIDDRSGVTLLSASTLEKELRDAVKELNKKDAAKKVGELLAQRSKAKGVDKVVFDRNGYKFHGRVSALAEGARGSGLQF